jgi:exopolysaccharide/PEP-CTERM locus tyrosine autokinase
LSTSRKLSTASAEQAFARKRKWSTNLQLALSATVILLGIKLGIYFNILQKNRKKSDADRGSIESLQPADWDALMQYNRRTGKLKISSRDVIKNPGTVGRLIAHKMILAGGEVTFAGKTKCEELSSQVRISLAGVADGKRGFPKKGSDSASLVFNDALLPSDLEALINYDRETGHLLKYNPESRQLDNSSLEILNSKGIIQRLLAQGLIHPGGKLTPQAIHICEQSVRETNPDKEVSNVPLPAPDLIETIDKNLVSILAPRSFEAEQFKMLRTNLLFPVSGQAPGSVLITSANQGDGKTFIAANLAVSVALNINRHVLLMDCDLRRPTIHRSFGLGNVFGLSEYLSKGLSLSSLLYRTKVERLTILPGGSEPSNPSELLSSVRMSALLEEVTQRYSDRLIIIDSPPPSMTDEARALARQVDGILVVIKHESTKLEEIKKLIETMGEEKIVGSVINHFDFRASGYYGYRYYRKYGSYYGR